MLKNETLKAKKQQGINSAIAKELHMDYGNLKTALLKQHTIENFINREYTHISAMLGNSNNYVSGFAEYIMINSLLKCNITQFDNKKTACKCAAIITNIKL